MTRDLAGKLARKFTEFLGDLSDDQLEKVRFGFPDEDERRDWAYFPRNHKGLPLHDLEPQQRKRAHDLLASCLSLPAYARVCTIMAIDDVLRQMEGGGVTSMRDSGRYFFSVFGAPSSSDSWGFRVEGHHVNLNFTFAGGEVIERHTSVPRSEPGRGASRRVPGRTANGRGAGRRLRTARLT